MCPHDSGHPVGLVLCDRHGYLIDHLPIHAGTFHTCTFECLQDVLYRPKLNGECSMFFSAQDYEEPLMFFSLNEEDEDDDLLQPVCGKAFY